LRYSKPNWTLRWICHRPLWNVHWKSIYYKNNWIGSNFQRYFKWFLCWSQWYIQFW